MKLTIGSLKRILNEGGRVSASPEYLSKELIREKLQKLIVDDVASGMIVDQGDLERFIDNVNVAMTALKIVPFDVWKKMANA